MGVGDSKEDVSPSNQDAEVRTVVDEQLKKLQFSYEILLYENGFLRRENKEIMNKLAVQQKKSEELPQKAPMHDFLEIANGSDESMEGLKRKCKYFIEVINSSQSNMNLLTNQLHHVLRTKYIECETLRKTIQKLRIKNELLLRELESINTSRKSNEMEGVEEHTQRLIQVFSSCNSSKITSKPSERNWDTDGCCLIPLTSPSSVTLKET